MGTIKVEDGAEIFFKDWARGNPCVISHGWPLSADAFEDQMFFLASAGYRCIAHDRRGHGRSSQPLDRQRPRYLRGRPGRAGPGSRPSGGRACRPLDGRGRSHPLHRQARYGSGREGRPDRRHPAADAQGRQKSRRTPIEAFDALRSGLQADRSRFWKD